MRLEPAAQNTRVPALHLGPADTDMSAVHHGPKVDPADVVRQALDGLEHTILEVVADEWTASIKASLAADPRHFHTGV